MINKTSLFWRFLTLIFLLIQSLVVTAEEVRVDAHASVSSPQHSYAKTFTNNSVGDEYFVPKQTLLLDIESLTSTWFTAAPVYPDWSLPGLEILKSQSQGLSKIRKIDGASYAGLQHRFLLVPMTTGTLAGNKIDVILTPGLSDRKHKATATIPAIDVRLPEGAESLESFLPASELTVNDKVSIDNNSELKVGDSITRTMTINAAGVMGAMIPIINPGDIPPGLSVYPGETLVGNTVSDRNDFIGGYRQQTLTIQIQQPGNYQLPEIRVRWWNLSTRTFETTTLAPVAFKASPAQMTEADRQLQIPLSSKWLMIIENNKALTAGLFFLMLCIINFRKTLFSFVWHCADLLERRVDRLVRSEPVAFIRSCLLLILAGKPSCLQAYLQWLRYFTPVSVEEPKSITLWLNHYYGRRPDTQNHAACQADQKLLGRVTLLLAFYQFRQSIMQEKQSIQIKSRAPHSLPDLNP